MDRFMYAFSVLCTENLSDCYLIIIANIIGLNCAGKFLNFTVLNFKGNTCEVTAIMWEAQL